MYKRLIPLLLVTGCSVTTPFTAEPYHPPFPAPYQVCDVTWEVLEVNGRAKIALSYDDNVVAAICDNDKNRYIKQLKELTCHYRKNIRENDPICIKENYDPTTSN